MIFSAAASTPWPARAGLLAALVLSAASAGCGQRACIEWSEQEGMCPAREATLTEHIGTCTNIVSVDDDGTREGELCCYAVTKRGPLPDCNVDPTTSGPTPPPEPMGCDNRGQCGDFFTFGCTACSAVAMCNQQLFDCQSKLSCANILNCEAKCSSTDLECQKLCETPNPDGLQLFRDFTSCARCQSCPNDCSESSNLCSTSSTSTAAGTGGAGGMSGAGGAGGMSGTGGAGGMSGAGGAGGKSP